LTQVADRDLPREHTARQSLGRLYELEIQLTPTQSFLDCSNSCSFAHLRITVASIPSAVPPKEAAGVRLIQIEAESKSYPYLDFSNPLGTL
jgi:hypothetical protein